MGFVLRPVQISEILSYEKYDDFFNPIPIQRAYRSNVFVRTTWRWWGTPYSIFSTRWFSDRFQRRYVTGWTRHLYIVTRSIPKFQWWDSPVRWVTRIWTSHFTNWWLMRPRSVLGTNSGRFSYKLMSRQTGKLNECTNLVDTIAMMLSSRRLQHLVDDATASRQRRWRARDLETRRGRSVPRTVPLAHDTLRSH